MSQPQLLAPEQLAEPTWEIAQLFPDQGNWSEEEYLALETNYLVEFSHGHIEVLAMPTQRHQFIVLFLVRLLQDILVAHQGGTVLQAPYDVFSEQELVTSPLLPMVEIPVQRILASR